jgi:hypothetical protein
MKTREEMIEALRRQDRREVYDYAMMVSECIRLGKHSDQTGKPCGCSNYGKSPWMAVATGECLPEIEHMTDAELDEALKDLPPREDPPPTRKLDWRDYHTKSD